MLYSAFLEICKFALEVGCDGCQGDADDPVDVDQWDDLGLFLGTGAFFFAWPLGLSPHPTDDRSPNVCRDACGLKSYRVCPNERTNSLLQHAFLFLVCCRF